MPSQLDIFGDCADERRHRMSLFIDDRFLQLSLPFDVDCRQLTKPPVWALAIADNAFEAGQSFSMCDGP